MANLEACGTGTTNLYFRATCGTDAANDWDVYTQSADNDLHLAVHKSGAYQDQAVLTAGGALRAVGGIAAGSMLGTQTFKVKIITGKLGSSGSDVVTLGITNKTLLVLGTAFDQSNWNVYDYRDSAVTSNALRFAFNVSGTGDTAMITYGSLYNGNSYTLIVFYRP
ncbi:MAG: hypothetical protein GXP62_02930 [Oligoflexia bacterium]|nr:hypothetical protein [Oligoflexia bacterium]